MVWVQLVVCMVLVWSYYNFASALVYFSSCDLVLTQPFTANFVIHNSP